LTAPKYHIYVECDSCKDKYGFRFNLSEEELIRTFVLPYNEGKPFWFGGKLFSASKINRAVIFWSNEDCNKLTMPNGQSIASCNDKQLVIENVCIGKVKGTHLCTEKYLFQLSNASKLPGSASESLQYGERKRVHIIHGPSQNMKEPVAQTLEDLKIDPVFLNQNPNQGGALMGEFSDYSEVNFAVVLLAPDEAVATSRANQNVVLELGFFLGKLGRKRVLALYEGNKGFELPADITGVGYTKMDPEGTWKYKLAKALRENGYQIDASLIK
jgi:predicted nucleotide-binding protein